MNTINQSPVPLPPDMSGLPLIEAEPWFQLDEDPGLFLEGPAFDREGNLFVTSPPTGKVFKITPQKQLGVVFDDKNVGVNGSAFHADGRLFIVCLTGEILVINPRDYTLTRLYPMYQGERLTMNDLVFDAQGNIYITHFTGTVMDPTGALFRISADATIVQPVVLNLASPNGVSLSPEGNVLWVGESARNAVLRITLLEDGVTCRPLIGVLPVYQTSGCHGPDSNKVDAAGNLYQCITGQGRVIVSNALGIPVANIVIPGRDDGKFLGSSNLAFKPGTDEGYITTSGAGGAWIFTFKGLDKGLTLFSHTPD